VSGIALDRVSLSYGAHRVLDDVSLRVAPGESLALLGPSASGKTSLLRAVLGLAVPGSGAVRLGERLVSRDGRLLVPPEDRNLAVVFQDLALWPHLSVEGNLAFGLSARGVRADDRTARIAAMLRRVGLDGVGRRHPGELSGGQRQRVAIARALVLDPGAVLLDEPLASVDVELKRDLLSLLRDLFRERSATVLHVTHDLREAAALADRFAVLEEGRLVQEGGLDDLRRVPATPFVRALVIDFDTRGPVAGLANEPLERRTR
jgi:ABC-type Fe3+/spermidine/putrescine transport system ATPase subunit